MTDKIDNIENIESAETTEVEVKEPVKARYTPLEGEEIGRAHV